jgi:ribonuclease HI
MPCVLVQKYNVRMGNCGRLEGQAMLTKSAVFAKCAESAQAESAAAAMYAGIRKQLEQQRLVERLRSIPAPLGGDNVSPKAKRRLPFPERCLSPAVAVALAKRRAEEEEEEDEPRRVTPRAPAGKVLVGSTSQELYEVTFEQTTAMKRVARSTPPRELPDESEGESRPAPPRTTRVTVIRCDGSCTDNGKKSATAAAAVHVRSPDGHEVTFSTHLPGVNTNNGAEYAAVLAAIRVGSTCMTAAKVVGDSKLVVEQVKGTMECRAVHLQPLHRACRRLLAANPHVELMWEARASNKDADKAAKDAGSTRRRDNTSDLFTCDFDERRLADADFLRLPRECVERKPGPSLISSLVTRLILESFVRCVCVCVFPGPCAVEPLASKCRTAPLYNKQQCPATSVGAWRNMRQRDAWASELGNDPPDVGAACASAATQCEALPRRCSC